MFISVTKFVNGNYRNTLTNNCNVHSNEYELTLMVDLITVVFMIQSFWNEMI